MMNRTNKYRKKKEFSQAQKYPEVKQYGEENKLE